jgi:hypothetical protein
VCSTKVIGATLSTALIYKVFNTFVA